MKDNDEDGWGWRKIMIDDKDGWWRIMKMMMIETMMMKIMMDDGSDG